MLQVKSLDLPSSLKKFKLFLLVLSHYLFPIEQWINLLTLVVITDARREYLVGIQTFLFNVIQLSDLQN